MTLHYRVLPDLAGVALDQSTPVMDPRPAGFAPVLPGLSATNPTAAGADQASGTLYLSHGKRAMDVVLASVALFLSLPVLFVLIAALWFEGGKPVFVQRRLGRHGRHFHMYKLRSMVVDAEERLAQCLACDPAMRAEWELTQKLKRDPRITPLGRLIRKTSLDELPQLINVIKGDMSLVGPRPMLPDQLPLYRAPSAYLRLRPGLTGLWQVTARNEDSFDLRAQIDHSYAQSLSLGADLRIIGATFGALWNATGY